MSGEVTRLADRRSPRSEFLRCVLAEVRRAIHDEGEELRRKVREDHVRYVPSSWEPPPVDIEAERSVIESLLCGRRRPSDLACCAKDMAVALHRYVMGFLEALEERNLLDGPPRLGVIVTHLRREGYDTRNGAAALVELQDHVPARVDVDELAERVHELAERRRALDLMNRIDVALRRDLRPDREDLRRLRALLDRWEGPCPR